MRRGWKWVAAIVVVTARGWEFEHEQHSTDLPTGEITRGDYVDIIERARRSASCRSLLVTAPADAGELHPEPREERHGRQEGRRGGAV